MCSLQHDSVLSVIRYISKCICCFRAVRFKCLNGEVVSMSQQAQCTSNVTMACDADNIENLHDWCKKRFDGIGDQIDGFFKEV